MDHMLQLKYTDTEGERSRRIKTSVNLVLWIFSHYKDTEMFYSQLAFVFYHFSFSQNNRNLVTYLVTNQVKQWDN